MSDYSISCDEFQFPAIEGESSEVPLAIRHNGPLKCLSMFPGVVERDYTTEKKKTPLPEESEKVADEKKTRRCVIGLSRKSRLRLQVRINRCKFLPGHVFFTTLTYPAEFPAHCVAKNDLRAFLKRIGRRFGKYGAIWRIENQKRGAPHFHIILFLGAIVPEHELTLWMVNAWYDIVGSGDPSHRIFGVENQSFRSARGLASYCSKYVSKLEEGDRVRLIEGRQWGREGDFPEERIDFVFQTEKDFYCFWRIIRRSKGLCGHVGPGNGYPWRNLFCLGLHDDWLRLASSIGMQTDFIPEDFYEKGK